MNLAVFLNIHNQKKINYGKKILNTKDHALAINGEKIVMEPFNSDFRSRIISRINKNNLLYKYSGLLEILFNEIKNESLNAAKQPILIQKNQYIKKLVTNNNGFQKVMSWLNFYT
jgi:hypothetical protein